MSAFDLKPGSVRYYNYTPPITTFKTLEDIEENVDLLRSKSEPKKYDNVVIGNRHIPMHKRRIIGRASNKISEHTDWFYVVSGIQVLQSCLIAWIIWRIK